MKILVCLLGALICLITCSFGQADSTTYKISQFPTKIFSRINGKTASLDEALTKQTQKYLTRLARQERKIRQRLYKLDSNAAKNIFDGAQTKYTSLRSSLASGTNVGAAPLTGEYLPNVDNLKVSLSFAQSNPSAINASPALQKQISAAMAQYNQLQHNLTQSDQIRSYIQQRKQMMNNQLMRYYQQSAVKKYMNQFNQQCYYYSEQVRQYREALNDPDQMMQKAQIILTKIPAYTKFMQRNSQLAGLFGISDSYGTPAAVAGLQTKDNVQKLLQGQIASGGSGGMAAFQLNLSSAHQQLDKFKDKIAALGVGSGGIDAPEFTPNPQKTNTFLKRLEFGTSTQTTGASLYYPTTTALTLSLGYRISSKNVIGILGSYDIGWGSDYRHIHISDQGYSFGTFTDIQIKKNFFISGGFTENYVRPYAPLAQLQTEGIWQESGLIGLSRIVSLPGRLVKKTKVSFLWDFLSYYQLPRRAAIKFQVGYAL